MVASAPVWRVTPRGADVGDDAVGGVAVGEMDDVVGARRGKVARGGGASDDCRDVIEGEIERAQEGIFPDDFFAEDSGGGAEDVVAAGEENFIGFGGGGVDVAREFEGLGPGDLGIRGGDGVGGDLRGLDLGESQVRVG